MGKIIEFKKPSKESGVRLDLGLPVDAFGGWKIGAEQSSQTPENVPAQPDDFEVRMNRIRASLEKINALMAGLRDGDSVKLD